VRASIVLLVFGLLGGVAALLWLQAGGAALPPPPPAAAAAAADATADAVAADADADWPTAESTPADAPAEQTDERIDAEAGGSGDGGRIVLVVRGEPPVPVADAEVLFCGDRDVGPRLQGLAAPPPRQEWPERWGQRVHTDADGRAVLPGPGGTLQVAARSGDEFAFATLRPGRRQATLHLAADEQVEVLVLHADDRPAAAAPIALLQSFGPRTAEVVWQGDTGADGRAVLRHFQLHRRAAKSPPGTEVFAAVARLPTAAPAHAPFAGRPATRETVVLRLPPVTTLAVQLTDHRGAPLLAPAWVAVRLDGKTDTAAPFPIEEGLLARHTLKPVGAEPVVLPFVPADTPLRVSAHFDGDRRGVSVVVPGVGADHAQVALPLGPRQVLLSGRCLHGDGAPFGPTHLPAALWHDTRLLQASSLHTVADGRFEFVLAGRSEPPPFVLYARSQPTPATDGAAPALGTRVSLGSLAGGRRLELGDLILGELPPLVAGVVVDDRDAAVAGADLRVQVRMPAPGRGDGWQEVPQLGTRAAADGTFVVHGERPPGELRLRGNADHHFPASEPLHTQGQQVRLRLDRNGIVRGRALLPDWLADEAASLLLLPFDESRRQTQSRSVPLRRRGGGRFTVEPLHPGRYDAIVTVRNVGQPVLVVADVFVPPGETRDPRLQALDLRQALFRYRLRAVDAAGVQLPIDAPIQARLSLPDGAVVEAGFRWQRGRAELITPGTQAELLLFGRGFQPQRLALGPGDHDVYLQALRPALLQLPGARALCGPQRRVRVSVILTDATGFPESLGGVDQRTGEQFAFARWDLGKSSGAWLEQYDVVEVPLMKSGRYEVVLRVHATASERSPQASVSLGVHELQVDAPSPAPVTVPVDAAAVQRAIAEVDQRQREAETSRSRR
jgi:hypothetical protein